MCILCGNDVDLIKHVFDFRDREFERCFHFFH